MPLLEVLAGHKDEVDIVRDMGDGNIVVKFRSHGAEMTVPSHLLTAAPGETHLAQGRPPGRLRDTQYVILSALARAGSFGMTDDEHEGVNGQRADSAGVRRGELVHYGYVMDTGDLRKTRRGKRAKVWQITLAGESALRTHELEGIA